MHCSFFPRTSKWLFWEQIMFAWSSEENSECGSFLLRKMSSKTCWVLRAVLRKTSTCGEYWNKKCLVFGSDWGRVRMVWFSAASETRMRSETPPEFSTWRTWRVCLVLWILSHEETYYSFPFGSVCGSVLTVHFSCVTGALREGKDLPRVLKQSPFPLVWQEAFRGGRKAVRHSVPIAGTDSIPW